MLLFTRLKQGHCQSGVGAKCDALLFFLLDMFDKTRTGRIDLFGFSALWDFMQRWRVLFQQYDRDRSGSISGMELQQGSFVKMLHSRLKLLSYSCSPLEGRNLTRTRLRLIFLHVCLVILSPGPDGLQPQPPVLWVADPALHSARPTSWNPAGPFHPGVHAAAVHDAGLPAEGHRHDGQRAAQLRGIPRRSCHQAHVSRHHQHPGRTVLPRCRFQLHFMFTTCSAGSKSLKLNKLLLMRSASSWRDVSQSVCWNADSADWDFACIHIVVWNCRFCLAKDVPHFLIYARIHLFHYVSKMWPITLTLFSIYIFLNVFVVPKTNKDLYDFYLVWFVCFFLLGGRVLPASPF